VSLEPGNWRHQFRLALASWGEERLRASDRALTLLPSCAAAHLVAAMVHVARGAWERAEAAAEAGARLQDAQTDGAVLPVAGLHWMRGMVLAGRERLSDAAAALSGETEMTRTGLYASEFRWLAQSCTGYLRLHERRLDLAAAAFRAAEQLNAGAARSTVGLYLSNAIDEEAAGRAVDELARGGKETDATLVRATVLAWQGQGDAAIERVVDLIGRAPPGPTGWSLAADPMFLPLRPHPRWPSLLAAVAARAA
jgi:hypothetical protein